MKNLFRHISFSCIQPIGMNRVEGLSKRNLHTNSDWAYTQPLKTYPGRFKEEDRS